MLRTDPRLRLGASVVAVISVIDGSLASVVECVEGVYPVSSSLTPDDGGVALNP